ncbi:hypothetical protein EBS40_02575 [bacterium]|nr:hypothetical protein [bacterium]
MPKYYIKSGQIKFILDSPDETSAILAALKHYKGKGMVTGPKICVSETGFDYNDKSICDDTDKYMKKV